MSFLRHLEIYQVSEHRLRDTELKRARPDAAPLLIQLDESPVGYSWRVALQQSPLPLHQPLLLCDDRLATCKKAFVGSRTQLNLWSHFRGAPHVARADLRCRLGMNDPPTALVVFALSSFLSLLIYHFDRIAV